jgi:DNA-binding LacI/PurR family transcriptional regulator
MFDSKNSPIQHQTKTQALRDHLSRVIGTLEPHAKLPTMRELCASLEVSPMTVNRALSELEAHGVLYRRQGSGTFVAPRSNAATPGVALVYSRALMGENASPFGTILLDEAERRARELNERFSLFLAMPAGEIPIHPDLQDAVENGRVRGVLYAGERNPDAAKWLKEHAIPVVALSFRPFTPHRVKIDHAQLIRLGVKAMAEQGSRRIGLVMPLGRGIGRDKAGHFPELEAFQSALKKHRIEYSPDLVWRADEHKSEFLTAESNFEQGVRATREIFASMGRKAVNPDAPDGLVISDDMMTRGVLKVFRELKIVPGKDVKIATHANRGSNVLAGHEAEITLIEIDPAEIVQAMFDTLETLMEGRKPASNVLSVKPHLASNP